MNNSVSLKQLSLIIGVVVALIIVFGMWASGSHQFLSYSFPSVEFRSIDFRAIGRILADFRFGI